MRTYGRFFAEFLNEDSPVHLRLLASPTCVGFRYGRFQLDSRGFSRQRAQQSCPGYPKLLKSLGLVWRGFAYTTSSAYQCKSNNTLCLQHCVAPLKTENGAGILTGCPSASPLGLSLGPTNPWLINIAKETLGLRCAGLSPALWLLIPTFSLPNAPLRLAS